jgi:hypothetical protein
MCVSYVGSKHMEVLLIYLERSMSECRNSTGESGKYGRQQVKNCSNHLC